MKHKNVADFTAEEKEWMDTIAVNYIVAQSDGFQLGYAQAISDLTSNISTIGKVQTISRNRASLIPSWI